MHIYLLSTASIKPGITNVIFARSMLLESCAEDPVCFIQNLLVSCERFLRSKSLTANLSYALCHVSRTFDPDRG